MSSHATAELLSLYLDAALSAAERRQVDEHLETCAQCRQRLDGLRRVVAGLARLPTAVPAEDLAARVAREIDLHGRRSRWRQILDTGLPAPLLGSPPIHLLALVLALGAIVYLFAFGVEMRRERPTRIVPLGVEPVLGERWAEAVATERGVAGDDRFLLGGRFRQADGVWVEEGLAGRPPDARLVLDAVASAPLEEAAQLLALGAPVRLRVGDEVVEIAFESVAPRGE